jgi:hypothetical protein
MPKRKITDLEKFTELERVMGVKAIPRTASAVKKSARKPSGFRVLFFLLFSFRIADADSFHTSNVTLLLNLKESNPKLIPTICTKSARPSAGSRLGG